MKPVDPRLLPHLRPARGALAGVVGAQALGGVLVVGQAFALGALVARLLADPQGTGWHAPAAWFAAALVGRALAGWFADVAAARAAVRVSEHVRRLVLRRALDWEATELARHRTGELGVLATRGVAALSPYLTRYVPALVVAGVLPLLTLAAITWLDWASGLVVALTLPLVPVFAALIGLSTRDRAERQWRLLSQLSGHFVDVVRGLPTLVAHRRAGAQSPVIRRVTERYREANAGVLRLAFASSAALELVATLSVALVAVLVGLRLAAGGLDLQTALTILLLAPEAYWPLRRVGAEFHAAAEGTATFEEIDALPAAPAPRGSLPAPVRPAPLRLDGLGASWPGRGAPALRHVDATVPATGLTVVVGPSGCGKSTLLAVLSGELQPDAGLVRVGGVDLSSIDPGAWRAVVAHLPQRPWLTDDTVAANVRLGEPGATDDQVRDALAEVDLLDAVEALPQGIDTPLGEDGAGLSAGQRARLAMARVLVSPRPFVLLDEPSAHLDAASEQVLLRAVRRLARTRCVVAVAHRHAMVLAADTLVELAAPPAAPGTPAGEAAVPSSLPTTDTAAPVGPGEAPGSRWRPGTLSVLATMLAVLAATSGVALTATAGWLIARSAEQPPVLMLMVAIVGVRTFGLARPAFRYAERLVSHDVALRLLARRRAEIYDLLVPLVPGRLGRRRGDLLASVVDDVDALLDEQLRVRMPVVTWLGTTLLTAGVAAWFLPVSGLWVALLGVLAGAVAWTVARVGAARAATRGVTARALLSRRVVALLGSARPLVQWQADAAALRSVDEAASAVDRSAVRTAGWLGAARGWPLVVAAAGVALMAWVGAGALSTGAVTGPVVALLVLVPLALVDVATPVADAGALRVSTAAATARLAALADLPPAVTDPTGSDELPADPHLRLDRVTAAWSADDVVGPVSLDLAPGRRIGVAGPSGSGKSTLAAVLVRFLAPTSGRHLVGGVPVARLRADDVRRVTGLLDDDPYLFASTLGENVRLARPGATNADVEAALRQASLGEWLDSLPDGLATRVGDGGSAVSGGERARIGVARLLLADHPVLVLDEPTAHLDTATAEAVADELLSLPSRSVVWITHGTVGLDRMDDVLVLGDAQGLRQVRAAAR